MEVGVGKSGIKESPLLPCPYRMNLLTQALTSTPSTLSTSSPTCSLWNGPNSLPRYECSGTSERRLDLGQFERFRKVIPN